MPAKYHKNITITQIGVISIIIVFDIANILAAVCELIVDIEASVI